MNSKERVLAAINFEEPDRVPFNFWMDRRLMDEYEKEFGEGWRVRAFGADVVETFFALPFPAGETRTESGTAWLVEPLIKDMETEVDALQMPDPSLDSVYGLISSDLANYSDCAVIADAPGVLTVAHGMRGYDNLFTDIYDYPKQVKSLFSRITDVMVEACERACEMGITALYVMDDIAYSNGLMMSLDTLEEFVFAFNKQQINVAKRYDVPVFLHSCGQVTNAIPSFIEQGVDVLNPLQPHLHDIDSFREQYNNDLAVYGALDNTHIIPHGSADDVRDHVLHTFDALGKDGGLVFSTHDIPLATPRENIEAMVDTIKQCTY